MIKEYTMEDVTLQVKKNGALTIPPRVMKACGFSPEQILVLRKDHDGIRLDPIHRERLERIGELLGTALKGVTWNDIEAGRKDRCV
jgi:antitoxin component of MazEF toxin-antitoxin module